ncbi:Crp/Fnr family transcriptional regulator [Streptomyces sp. NPDC059506]|uniref:Crp/Fnr family transcriptional regulator n=1 Tax=Streptomyces TaxID=1883 RepID=UPI000CAD92FE|nr:MULTISPECIES: Crp/Fnr family transcriptional regulator [unclassified Streptomyces]MCZ2523259.1 Crp/Fnr family transcriptional regulator [Streptomyces sp. HB2AG]PLW62495.1 transcriptional regulator [Streptomyces sp. DJ]QMV23376.1 cyclic nucleotide-binding domain-containing protein [Streptomyces sp. SCUT-3]
MSSALGDRVPFLARLEPAARQELLALGVPQPLPDDTVVLHEGEPSRHVLLVLDGWLKVTATSANGHEALLALRGPGDVVGELAAIDGRPRSARVTTLGPVRVVTVRSEDFVAHLETRPKVAVVLLGLLADRLRTGDRKRLESAAHRVDERLARLLLDLAEQHGQETPEGIALRVPLSQRELAGCVGASREAVARALEKLRKRGAILTMRRRIVVTRPEVLRQTASSVQSVTDAVRRPSSSAGARRSTMDGTPGARGGSGTPDQFR